MESSGKDDFSYENLKASPDAVMGEALSVHYSGGSSLPDDVEEWLRTNGMIE